jgi:hypothetical protein
VDLGGALQPGKPVPVLIPLALTELGFHSLPVPLRPPPGPAADTREGRWSELEGIVRSVNTNGALSLAGADGRAYLWIGQVPSNRLAGYVDAKVRARGVLLLTALEAPLLLVPSPDFVDLEEPPVPNPFTLPPRPIANVVPEKMASAWGHRVRVVGEVTYRDFRSFVVQDDSGGIRVQFAGAPSLSPGETVDVIAFPTEGDGVRSLTDAQVHPARESFQLKPAELDSETASATQSGTLVQLTATLLDRKVGKAGQVLELQEQQRIFAASRRSRPAAGFRSPASMKMGRRPRPGPAIRPGAPDFPARSTFCCGVRTM